MGGQENQEQTAALDCMKQKGCLTEKGRAPLGTVGERADLQGRFQIAVSCRKTHMSR